MSIQGQSAREGFKTKVLRMIDDEIARYREPAEFDYKPVVIDGDSATRALEKLKKQIQKIDTA